MQDDISSKHSILNRRRTYEVELVQGLELELVKELGQELGQELEQELEQVSELEYENSLARRSLEHAVSLWFQHKDYQIYTGRVKFTHEHNISASGQGYVSDATKNLILYRFFILETLRWMRLV